MTTFAINKMRLVFVSAALLISLASGTPAFAKTEFSMVADPVREVAVRGDEDKFRADNWRREGYGGGIEDLWLEQSGLTEDEDVSVSINHRSMVRDDDYLLDANVEKGDLAFLRFHFREFTKYYDDEGGTYHPFTQLYAPELSKDLALHLGELSVEAGINPEDTIFPAVTFKYEKRMKDGNKSRLTWGNALEGAVTRAIVPSYMEVDEDVDIFEITAEKEIKGFELKGEQHWEITEAHYRRYETNLTSSGGAVANNKKRLQDQRPEADVMTTTAWVERWSLEERLFTGSAYNFTHLTNEELENIFEMNAGGGLQNFANPKAIINAFAENEYDAHTWVQSLMYQPWQPVSLGLKFKSEIIDRDGNSTYPQDTTVGNPDGIVNTTENSFTNNKVGGFGEAIELRYTGIPHTALYNEVEFEQVRNWISEDRKSLAGQSAANANEIFSRETITYIQRAVWTIGMHASPWKLVDFTLHFRHAESLNDYEDERETDSTATTARSSFVDSLSTAMNEIAHRITFKPCRKVRTSLRYQMQLHDYRTGVENEGLVETDMNAHIFSFDISLTPNERLMFLTSLSRQHLWVATPASSSATAQAPRFNADVTSWFFNTNYILTERVTLIQGFDFTIADNFDDFTASGLPLGTDFYQTGANAGVKFQITEHMAIEPKYGVYLYRTSSLADTGNYTAHALWLRTILNWG